MHIKTISASEIVLCMGFACSASASFLPITAPQFSTELPNPDSQLRGNAYPVSVNHRITASLHSDWVRHMYGNPGQPMGVFFRTFVTTLERGTLFPLEFLSPGCILVAAGGHHRKSIYLEIKPIIQQKEERPRDVATPFEHLDPTLPEAIILKILCDVIR